MDRDHTVSIYDWKANVVVGRAYGGSNHIIGVFFTDPLAEDTLPSNSSEEGYDNDSTGGGGNNEDDASIDGGRSSACSTSCGLVTYGANELRFWRGVNTRFPSSVRPRLGDLGVMQQSFLCGEMFNGSITIGTADGHIYVFQQHPIEGSRLKQAIKAHAAPLTAMDVCIHKKLLVTGGKDGAVRLWNSDMGCIKEFALDSMLTDSINPSVRSVGFNTAGNHLIVGTRSSEIFEISIIDGVRVGNNNLVEAHGIRQLWGLAAHPTKEECVTTGDDATLR